ncbi:proteasome 26S subunit [Rhodotorula diobovata]|uniref:Proteasome 26S subunit n=1 Tax=Rhodotorula diobovata TaxID=5288 RepID=A0A5C5FSY0_9BASI|nr:proteasome 26S subunit [Rhodotorula diobovata]
MSAPPAPAPSSSTAAAPVDDAPLPIPNLQLPQLAFNVANPRPSVDADKARADLLEGIQHDHMVPYLEHLVQSGVLPDQSDLVSRLKQLNSDELKRINDKLQDATTNLGEMEISDALREKATYLARIGEKDAAIKAHDEAFDKTAGKGSKIDLVLSIVRIALFHSDHELVISSLDRAQKLVDEGGDWDRRNRLKVYTGVHLLSIRNFRKAAELLLDALPTFTATELIPYDEFVTLCVLAGVFSLERKDLRKKVIDAPEVIAVLPAVPTLKDFAESLWKCDYAAFFRALATVEEHHLLPSRLLAVHARYYSRELRIKAYAQLLESYRSVTLESLAAAFGVSKEWLDADLARFIAAGRLSCTIDRVSGIVETHRPDAKNARYAAVIKQGDAVLTSVQRLSRVIG